MRILDRYVVRQLLPVWLWCLVVFVFLSCLIDLFERLDEILRYHIPLDVVIRYYAHFTPLVIVRAAPLALLLATAFITTRLTRYQELLAMNASGTSLLRASVPFLFVGWLASVGLFLLNEYVVPTSTTAYERIRQEAFRSPTEDRAVENVAIIDAMNRLYHARQLDLETHELTDLTILEHDRHNHPVKSLYASRAIWTTHGWLLLYGTVYRMGEHGRVRGDPEPFVERLIAYPVTPASFAEPESRPETMRFSQLRLLINRLTSIGITNVRRYQAELHAKVTLPLISLIICLIGFVGSSQQQLRGNLRGLGLSLGWGILYYLAVGVGQSFARQGLLWLPTIFWVWAPHLLAAWWCVKRLRTAA